MKAARAMAYHAGARGGLPLLNLEAWADRRERFRAEGRERYRDMTEEQRAQYLPEMVELSGKGVEDERQFARGWLDELQRARKKR